MMRGISSKGEKLFSVIIVLLLALFGLVCVYPIYYIIIGSVSDSMEMMKHTGFSTLR